MELKLASQLDRLWALSSLTELEPEAVANAAQIVWEVDEDPPPPSRRHAWIRFAYAGLVREPFASVVLAWQPQRRVGRVDVTPTRIVGFSQPELDAALRERGAPKGEAGVAPVCSARTRLQLGARHRGRLRGRRRSAPPAPKPGCSSRREIAPPG